jgi:hypothetical protein
MKKLLRPEERDMKNWEALTERPEDKRATNVINRQTVADNGWIV